MWSLKKVTLPNSVEEIQEKAFFYCPIDELCLPTSLTSISHMAFAECQLQDLVIPNSVLSIGYSAFSSNHSRTLNIVDGINNLSIGKSAFSYNDLISVVIPSRVRYLDCTPFYMCDSLTSIEFPDSVIVNGNVFADTGISSRS